MYSSIVVTTSHTMKNFFEEDYPTSMAELFTQDMENLDINNALENESNDELEYNFDTTRFTDARTFEEFNKKYLTSTKDIAPNTIITIQSDSDRHTTHAIEFRYVRHSGTLYSLTHDEDLSTDATIKIPNTTNQELIAWIIPGLQAIENNRLKLFYTTVIAQLNNEQLTRFINVVFYLDIQPLIEIATELLESRFGDEFFESAHQEKALLEKWEKILQANIVGKKYRDYLLKKFQGTMNFVKIAQNQRDSIQQTITQLTIPQQPTLQLQRNYQKNSTQKIQTTAQSLDLELLCRVFGYHLMQNIHRAIEVCNFLNFEDNLLEDMYLDIISKINQVINSLSNMQNTYKTSDHLHQAIKQEMISKDLITQINQKCNKNDWDWINTNIYDDQELIPSNEFNELINPLQLSQPARAKFLMYILQKLTVKITQVLLKKSLTHEILMDMGIETLLENLCQCVNTITKNGFDQIIEFQEIKKRINNNNSKK